MKNLIYVMLLICGIGVVEGENIYSQSYSHEEIVTGFITSTEDDSWLCDDFILDSEITLGSVSVWSVVFGSQRDRVNIVILEDTDLTHNPNTSNLIWETSILATEIVTGDYWLGLELFEIQLTIPIDNRPVLKEGIHYYIGFQFENYNLNYTLVSDNYIDDTCWYTTNGNPWKETTRYPYGGTTDLFIEMYGESSSLQSTSWGNLKKVW